MKKLLLLAMLLISSITFSQSKDNGIEPEQSFESVLLPYVEKTLKSLEKGVEYASEEIPIVLEQYVLYTAVTSWLYAVLGIIMTIVGIKLGLYFWKKDWEGGEIPSTFIAMGMGGIGGLVMFFTHIEIAIKSTFFPKLFLVEKFINLI